ncbi:MAG: hypothetical protein WCF18_16650 [Chthoniobacteraceae bacterium]
MIVNRTLMASDGSGPVRNVDIDLGRLGTRPLALLLALIFATPIPWKRRAVAAVVGLLLLHVGVLLFLSFCLWVESAEVQLVAFSPTMKALAKGAEAAGVAQFPIAGPVLIWIVVTFRREDIMRLLHRMPPSQLPDHS